MAVVVIGIDPHKASHTAVAISPAEELLGELRVRASLAQAGRLLEWAAAWPERTWAVEGAGGMGHLLAQQLLGAGERVLDVQPKLGARVRLLAARDTNKNDPNDARSVAVAALRSPGVRGVRADDHAVVLKGWSKRHRDLGRTRTQIVCRLAQIRRTTQMVPATPPTACTSSRCGSVACTSGARGTRCSARVIGGLQSQAPTRSAAKPHLPRPFRRCYHRRLTPGLGAVVPAPWPAVGRRRDDHLLSLRHALPQPGQCQALDCRIPAPS